jgi:hypothetical protein
MAEIQCENCAWRAKYDVNPKSFLGRLWKWHIKFCPGWKMYLTSLSESDRQEIYAKYGYRKI